MNTITMPVNNNYYPYDTPILDEKKQTNIIPSNIFFREDEPTGNFTKLKREPILDTFFKEDMPNDLIESKMLSAKVNPKTVVEGIGFLTAALTGLRKLIEEGKSLKDAIDALFPNSSKEEKAALMDAISI